LIAKKILKDKNLSELASFKFNSNIDRKNEDVMFVEGAQVTNLLDKERDERMNFEVELPNKIK